MIIELGIRYGYEVQYNSELDSLEVRPARAVQYVADPSGDGYRSGGFLSERQVGTGEFRVDNEIFGAEDFLARGRELYAIEKKKAEKRAAYESRPVLEIGVKDGMLLINGQLMDVRPQLSISGHVRFDFEGYRLVGQDSHWLGEPFESPRVGAYESKGSVVVNVSDENFE